MTTPEIITITSLAGAIICALMETVKAAITLTRHRELEK